MHNIYSLLEISATFAGLVRRNQSTRPFVLTRSFFAGAQKYAAVWTGDCKASWDHLRLNLSILQNLSMCGINFCGSDIPGFFGEASDEMTVRGYQAGVFFPFMRGHADKQCKRREPWMLGKDTCQLISEAIHLRYELLPYLYTTFYHNAHSRTWPVVTPLWAAFKDTENEGIRSIEDQFMFGSAFLAKPICAPDVKV